MKPTPPAVSSLRSEDSKEVFLAIQVDGVTRARTALLTLRGSALPLNHTFHLELERARLLRLLVLTPGEPVLPSQWTSNFLQAQQNSMCLMSVAPKATVDPLQPAAGATRNRVCCLGRVSIPPLFKGDPHCSALSALSHLSVSTWPECLQAAFMF